MPRTPDDQFISTHHWLAELWHGHLDWFSYLSHDDQRALHDYYQLSHDLRDADLLAHRAAITDQLLPQQAGKAAVKLDRLITKGPRASNVKAATTTSRTFTDKRGKQRHLSVRSVLNPEIDTKKFARALVAMAMRQAEAEQRDRK